MSNYDFSKLTNRFDTNSTKWNIKEDELPMWIADMDFECAPEIIEALHQRVDHKIFGYNDIDEKFYESIQQWWKRRHNFDMSTEWMMFCTGIVPAISSIVRKMTTVGENVLVQAPVYNMFYNSIINNGRNILSSDLVYENGEYRIDYADLEAKLALSQTTLMILCNPHNPIGKIWDKETLSRIGELCAKHNVIVVADEIHCDIVAPNQKYTPFASVLEVNKMNSITCIAPTKAFNMAGLQISCIVVPNPVLRAKVNRGINTDEVAEPNSFAQAAAIAAFDKGEQWLAELCEYIENNKAYVINTLKNNLPSLHVVFSQATYLLWIDCSSISYDSIVLTNKLRELTGLFVSGGTVYGGNGKHFIRMNIACPMERLKDGVARFISGINQICEHE